MISDLGKDVVYCDKCRKPIALPYESPLGIFQEFGGRTKSEWPATFLCPRCGKVFVCSDATIDDEVRVRVQDSLLPDLLRVEYSSVQENAEMKKVIYTTCPKDADPKGEMPRLLKSLPEIGGALKVKIHVSPFQLTAVEPMAFTSAKG
jgi:hypothetical protein